jgi:class 3 adenylate cyclase/tetratricopeptide (TPR) repeat protein
VLFVDLVGFTPLAEKRDPEELRELLSLYFDRAQTIVGHYGGTVEKFIGDAVVAIWGAPVANEDDAERSVRAALDLVVSVADLGSKSGVDLAARAGIMTGEVAITIGKVSEGMVIGDTVNAASRIQSVAAPGSVLVDEATRRAASRAVVFSDVGALSLKGKEQPVHAWRAERIVAQPRGVGRSERLEPPFVGRAEELGLVKELLNATARDKSARLVSVSGIAGIGKSRLSWELRKYVDDLAETVYWHEGRSPAYGEGITFWPLGEMVRMRAGINESEDAASSRSKLTSSLSTYISDPEERGWIEPRLAHLLGLGEAPPGEREELFSAWRTFFERVAERGAAVMVFEDLQWSDPGLIDFIESILEWSTNSPILVVTLSRPELMDRRPSWGVGRRAFTSLRLEPLAQHAMAGLLDGFVRNLTEELKDQVLERSEGVPLYAVETVRMLADRGVLGQDEGGYYLAGDPGFLEIPDTLHALVASRLDTLSVEQRSLLEDAAVVGRTFQTALLAVVHGGDQMSLETHLRDLVQREFLALETDPRSPEQGRYGFVQGLIAEVAYATLSRRDRSAKHLALARHLESLADEELAVLVAAHYVEAHRACFKGPEADLIAVDARNWLSRAGRRALSLGSPEQALSLFEQALDMTNSGGETASLLELAGIAASHANASDRAIALYDEAIAYYETAGDRNAVGRVMAKWLLVFGMWLHRFAEAIERAEPVFHAMGEDGEERVRAELACELAWAHGYAGSYPRALEWSESALALAARLDAPELSAHVLGAKSLALFDLGSHQEAIVLAREAVELAEAAGSLLEQTVGWMHLSAFVIGENPREALSAMSEAAELARRAGDRGLEIGSLRNVIAISVALGEWGVARATIAELGQPEHGAVLEAFTGNLVEASRLLRVAEDRCASSEHVPELTGLLVSRAYVSLAEGDLGGARQAASAALSAEPLGMNSPEALAVKARSSLWSGDLEGVRTAVSAMTSFSGRWVETVRLTAEAGLAALEGRVDEAAGSYRDAIDAWRALKCTLDLALCELDLVLLLGPKCLETTAANEARDIFTQLGAKPFLERLNGAAGPEQ